MNIMKAHHKGFEAPKPTDCRSPCPALNTLANHGLLPRDGKNIDHAQLKTALIDIYGLGSVFGTIFAKAATKKFANPATGKFSLCDLLISDRSKEQASGETGIEHLASLTRVDRPDFTRASDNTQRSPSQEQINILLNSSKDGKMITVSDFVKARSKYWDKTFAAKPAYKTDSLITTEKIVCAVEGCLMLGALSGNSNEGKFQISKPFAQSILFEERLPVGWRKSTNALGLPELFSCLTQQGISEAANALTAAAAIAKHWFGLRQ
jgi:hypothetical protein